MRDRYEIYFLSLCVNGWLAERGEISFNNGDLAIHKISSYDLYCTVAIRLFRLCLKDNKYSIHLQIIRLFTFIRCTAHTGPSSTPFIDNSHQLQQIFCRLLVLLTYFPHFNSVATKKSGQ